MLGWAVFGTELGQPSRQSRVPWAAFEGDGSWQHWAGAAQGAWLGKAGADQLLTSHVPGACRPIY